MSRKPFDAVIFDLDGVVTETADVHAKAWKETFDELLDRRAEEGGEPFREFTNEDYLAYVDGKPRYRGVESFLRSRGIDLPLGDPGDPPGWRTVCGVGNRKNRRFNELLDRDGVMVYPGSSELMRALTSSGYRVAVATSSKNARRVLGAAGLLEVAEALVDGEVSARRNLRGKPEPDIFTTACAELGAERDRTAVVEDARSGVEAAAAGSFGLVVGVARRGDGDELLAAGADLVVRDLAELDLERLEAWFREDLPEDLWSIAEQRFDPALEKAKEALTAVGNGYFATRGAAEESRAGGPRTGDSHYPGTYLAGVYNRLESKIAGRTLIHEDLVNCPSWLPVRFRIEDGEWLDLANSEVLAFHRRLDLRDGCLHREIVLRDAQGRETRVRSARLSSMADPHLAALSYAVEPLDYRARITLRSGLDGGVENAGVERYRALASRHLEPVESGGEGGSVHLVARTRRSRIDIAEASRNRFFLGGERLRGAAAVREEGAVYSEIAAEAAPGRPLAVEKVVAICTSRDAARQNPPSVPPFSEGGSPRPPGNTPPFRDSGEDPLARAREAVRGVPGFETVLTASREAWSSLWREADLEVDGDRLAQKVLRLHVYHLLVTAGPHHRLLDAGIPARGLHGEAYRGHVFWDEMFVLPFYSLHFPEIARALLRYRCRRLDQARANAAAVGLPGAMFPWQSGSDGREETPEVHLNPASGEWGPDRSRRQRHVSLAVAYNALAHVHAASDLDFLAECGAELACEIARFWAGKTELDDGGGPTHRRNSIAGVMGPDEFHEAYPGAAEAGLCDNAYTNVMAAWLLEQAREVLSRLPADRAAELRRELGLTPEELARWQEIGRSLNVPLTAGGILEQFAGFSELRELDWDAYRARYGDVRRLDRILKAEGDSPDRYRVSKQADALMLFYLLPPAELRRLLERLGVPWRPGLPRETFDHYLRRTTHGSTLSALVHGVLAWRLGDRELGWELFRETLLADVADVQGGTTGEGIHVGAMAGSVLWVLGVFAGVEWREARLAIRPDPPPHWRRLACSFRFQRRRYRLEVTPETVRIELVEGEPAEVEVAGRVVTLGPGEAEEVPLG